MNIPRRGPYYYTIYIYMSQRFPRGYSISWGKGLLLTCLLMLIMVNFSPFKARILEWGGACIFAPLPSARSPLAGIERPIMIGAESSALSCRNYTSGNANICGLPMIIFTHSWNNAKKLLSLQVLLAQILQVNAWRKESQRSHGSWLSPGWWWSSLPGCRACRPLWCDASGTARNLWSRWCCLQMAAYLGRRASWDMSENRLECPLGKCQASAFHQSKTGLFGSHKLSLQPVAGCTPDDSGLPNGLPSATEMILPSGYVNS